VHLIKRLTVACSVRWHIYSRTCLVAPTCRIHPEGSLDRGFQAVSTGRLCSGISFQTRATSASQSCQASFTLACRCRNLSCGDGVVSGLGHADTVTLLGGETVAEGGLAVFVASMTRGVVPGQTDGADGAEGICVGQRPCEGGTHRKRYITSGCLEIPSHLASLCFRVASDRTFSQCPKRFTNA
jgi:hypothetical protein